MRNFQNEHQIKTDVSSMDFVREDSSNCCHNAKNDRCVVVICEDDTYQVYEIGFHD
jgi:hypothetical protein